jgi:hypothetical protein
MMCDNCEKPKVCPDDCGMYQDIDYENELLVKEKAALEMTVKRLRADVDAWKGLSKERYHKMVDANLQNKELEAALEERINIIRDDRDEKIEALGARVTWLEKNREVLLKTIAHKNSQLEFLR